MNKGIDVIVAGHITFDMTPKFSEGKATSIEELFIPGKLINVEEVVTSTGGPVSNTGLAMHTLGAKVTFMAKVADDFFGHAIINYLKNKVSVGGIKIVKGESSSYTIVIAPRGIDRMFLHNPGTNDSFCYDDIDFDLVKDAKLFHLGYPPLMKRLYQNDGEELRSIYEKVNQLGVTTALDFALPDPNSPSGKVDWSKVLKKVLPYVDIFLPSVEEAQFMLDKEKFLELREIAKRKELLHLFDGKDLTQLSNKLLSYGSKIVGLKCGERGFYIKTASKDKLKGVALIKPGNLDNWSWRELWEPAYQVEKFASATGSGDSAIAGFLVALLRDETIEMCLKYGCMCGAQNVQVLDAVSGIKNWEQTTTQLKSGWNKNELKITTVGWKFDSKEELWHGSEDKQSS